MAIFDPDLWDEVDTHSKRTGIDPNVLYAQVMQESGGNPSAVSPKGARTRAQIMPATMRDPGYGVQPYNPGVPGDDLRFQADYMRALGEQVGGDLDTTLAAYNAGLGAVKKAKGVPNFPETRGYISKIKGTLAHLSPAQAAPIFDPDQDLGNGPWPYDPDVAPLSAKGNDETVEVIKNNIAAGNMSIAEGRKRLESYGYRPEDTAALVGYKGRLERLPEALGEIAKKSSLQSAQGILQMREGNKIRGAANIAMGGLGLALSPIEAVTQTYIKEPIQHDTGSEVLGKVAQVGAELLIPGLGLTKLGKAGKLKPPRGGPPVKPLEAPQEAITNLPNTGVGADVVPPLQRGITPEDLLSPITLEDKITGLNLSKLDTPDSVKQFLTQTEQEFPEIAAAQGGKVSWKQTQQDVQGLLDSGEAKRFMNTYRTKPGEGAAKLRAAKGLLTKSAEESTALAQKAVGGDVEALKTFEESLQRTLMYQQVVAGARAEAGRTLQILRQRVPGMEGVELAAKNLEGVGGSERVKAAAQMIADAAKNGESLSPAKLGQLAKASKSDKVFEYYVNSILSGPWTHIVNTVSNAGYSVLNQVERRVASAFSDDVIVPASTLAAIPKALRATTEAFAKEASVVGSKLEARQGAIGGLLGRIVRVPGRALQAEDAFFQTMAYQGHLNGLAWKAAKQEGLKGDDLHRRAAELIDAPTDDMAAAALKEAQRMTFTQDPGAIGQFVSRIANAGTSFKPLKYVLPFVRTPANILRATAERSPIAAMMPSTLKALRGQQGKEAQALAMTRMAMGSSIMALGAMGVSQGYVTGAAPKEPRKRALWYAAGNQPYSIKVGDKWLPYNRLDPLGGLVGWTADAAQATKGSDSLVNGGLAVLGSFAESALNKSFLTGVSDFADVLSDPARFGVQYASRMSGAFVPFSSALRQTGQMIDPVLREPSGPLGAFDPRKNLPFASMTLPAKPDVFGQPTVRGRVPQGAPIPRSPEGYPEAQQLLDMEVFPSEPSESMTVGGQKIALGPESDRANRIAVGQQRLASIRQYGGPGDTETAENILSSGRQIGSTRAMYNMPELAGELDPFGDPYTPESLDPVKQALLAGGVSYRHPSNKVGGKEIPKNAYHMYLQMRGKILKQELSRVVKSTRWEHASPEGRQKFYSRALTRANARANPLLMRVMRDAKRNQGDVANFTNVAE